MTRVVEVRLELGGHYVETVLAEGPGLDLGAPPRVLPEGLPVHVGATIWQRHVFPVTSRDEACAAALVNLESARRFPTDPEAAARCVRRGMVWAALGLAAR